MLWKLFLSFTKIGILAYGSGPAMLPMMQNEIVDGQGWVSDDDFRAAISAGYSLPGPIAPKIALWTGLQVAGLPGAIISVIAITLPGTFLMYMASRFMWERMDNPHIAGAARGAGIAVIGLLAYITYIQAYKFFIGDSGQTWWSSLRAKPDAVLLIMVVFMLVMWQPRMMIPLSIALAALYGAFFLTAS